MLDFFKRIWRWFDDRTGLSDLARTIAEHPVPPGVASNKTGWMYIFGAATLVAFIVQGVTGIVLGTRYVPSTAHAYDSLIFITEDVTLGAFTRGMHYYGASALIVLMMLHVFRVFLTGSYKYPREISWISGVALLLITFLLAFTGQLLRWDQNSVWSVVVSAYYAEQVPLIGGWLATFILGGTTVSGATLSRFFAFHVFFLPALLVMVLGLHLYLVWRTGISEPPKAGRPVEPRTYRPWYERLLRRYGQPYWPDGSWLEVVFSVGAVMIIALLALVFGPRELAGPPDPTFIQADPRPDWYLIWYYALLSLYPPGWEAIIMVYAPLAVVAVLVLIPIIANKGERSPLRRPWAVGIVAGTALSFILLTAIGFRAPWVPDFEVEPLPMELYVDAEPAAGRGAALLHARGCLYCHQVAGQGGIYGPDLTRVSERLPREVIKVRTLRGIGNMPPYADVLIAEEMEDIVVFFEQHQSR